MTSERGENSDPYRYHCYYPSQQKKKTVQKRKKCETENEMENKMKKKEEV